VPINHAYYYFYRGGFNLPYVYLSDVNFNASGCKNGITSPADQEIAWVSREFADTVTDPEGTAWTPEIGEVCDAKFLREPVCPVNLGISSFIVQKLWSNDASSCVSSWPTIINLSPDSGPNNGQERVVVQGGGLFNPSGESQFFFNVPPASGVSLPASPASGVSSPASEVSCNHDGLSCAVTAPDSHGALAGTITVTANVGGFESNDQPPSCPTNLGISCSGRTGPVFTYEPPPPCKGEWSCMGHPFGFPSLNVTCKDPSGSLVPVNFFNYAGTSNQVIVTTDYEYSFPVNEIEGKVSACLRVGYSPSYVGCSYFEDSEPNPNYCGKLSLPPGYCAACTQHGGHCQTFPLGEVYCVLLGPIQPLPNK
jgi:hypothetical protein